MRRLPDDSNKELPNLDVVADPVHAAVGHAGVDAALVAASGGLLDIEEFRGIPGAQY